MLGVASFNFVVDPYRLFRTPAWHRFNEKKDAATNQIWLYKAYEVKRIRPVTLLLGSSRVAAGVDALSSSWPAGYLPVYNLGIDAATPYVEFRYLQHVMSTYAPREVVIGLDFESFLDVLEADHSVNHGFEFRLATNADGTANAEASRQHISDLVNVLLSYDALGDAVDTVTTNMFGNASGTEAGNEVDTELENASLQTGTFPWFEWLNFINVRRFSRSFNSFAMSDLQSLIDLCLSHKVHVVLYIHPIPAETLEIMDRVGCWSTFEDWKRNLVRLTSEYDRSDAAGSLVLWDFSGYDEFSTEAAGGNRHVMRWFTEAWHYSRALGDLVIQRVTGQSTADFGERLTSENLEAHLAEIRRRRLTYRETHPEETTRVQAIYNAGIQALKRRLALTAVSTRPERRNRTSAAPRASSTANSNHNTG